MPTYSYACKNCGHQFDIVQAFSDNALTDCPECGGRLRKVFNSVGVVFKGSGFYRTDSRGGSSSSTPASTTSNDSSTSSSNGSGDSAAKPAASSDSKPAASTATKSAD
ncbi:FmdB family zinc ribbon protein [Calidifontibacter indicus]|uniref:Putative FmdB family regulatory protein n=1 Tax=Calidifontibacter indicus TaxID=419650 RepID=A0A3D9ULK7_9MICO|nr:FmdB family zinc ribbon protein [Calidifontibacter indicus]REF30226.1 putative FmdB family regulatory protein [Calidifontibacter indicus]